MSAPAPKSTLPRGDLLAIERTLLANERTFLAYFRTSVVFLSAGLAILNIEFFAKVRYLATFLIGLSPCILAFGLWRLVVVRKNILRHARPTSGASLEKEAGEKN